MKNLLFIITFLLTYTYSQAQTEVINFDFKKGEVLDILLVNRVPNSAELYTRYRETALPVAYKYTFELMTVLGSQDLHLGTPAPSTFIVGKWDNIERRESFLANIVDRVPDFHEQRADVFTYFVLTYYEMKEQVSFTINRNNYTVATSFWKNEDEDLAGFEESWKNDVLDNGGKIILTVEDGVSPTGYYYNPDTLYLIEWEDEAQFKKFASKYHLQDYEILKNIHQFSID